MKHGDVIEGGSARTGWGDDGAVVSLASRRPPRRFGVVEDVHAYWETLRAGRVVPLRSEIDPRGIDGALDCAFIVERIAPGFARFRLAGTFLVDLMGAEVKGMPLSMLFGQGSRRALSEAVEGVFAGPEVLRMDLAAPRGIGRPTIEGEMILLPLRSDLGDVTRALGCLVTRGNVGRAPRRLSIQGVERTDAITGLTPSGERPRASGALRAAMSDADPLRRPAPPAEPASGAPRSDAPRPAPSHPAPSGPEGRRHHPGGIAPVAETPAAKTPATEPGPVLRPVPGAPHLRVLED